MWEEARKEGVIEQEQHFRLTGSLTGQHCLSKYSGNKAVVSLTHPEPGEDHRLKSVAES